MNRRSRRQRRSGPETYRPPRDRREVAIAVGCAIGVLVVTVALLFVLRPRDDSPPEVPIPVPPELTSTPPVTQPAPIAPPPGPTPAPVP